MKLVFFVTGTDTHVGKTYCSVGLLTAMQARGLRTIGLKPVASGAIDHANGLRHPDALALQAAASEKLPYSLINPFAFQESIAPHLAATPVPLTVARLTACLQPALNHPADVYLIEGIGGWFVPLAYHERMDQFVVSNRFKVILVVGIRLGCLNHALLTYHAMAQHQPQPCIGWIANCLDPTMAAQEENIATLKERLPLPHLGTVIYGQSPALSLDIDSLMTARFLGERCCLTANIMGLK